MAVVSARGKGLLTRTAALIGQPLFANAGYLLGVDVVASLVGFVFWGLAARLVQAEEIGVASAILSAVALVSGMAEVGMGSGLVRFLPEARSPMRLLNTVFTFNTAMAVLVGGVFLGGLRRWSPSLAILQQNAWYAAGFLAYTAVTTLGAVVRMAFVARRQAGYALAQACVVNGGRLALVVVLAGQGAIGVVGSVAIAMALAVALSLVGFLRRVEPGYRPRLDFSWPNLAGILPYSAGSYVAVLLAQTSQMALPLIVMEKCGAASSGHAYVGWMLGSLLVSPGLALANAAFAEGANSPHKLSAILMRAATLGLSVTLPVASVLGITAPWVLLLFGAGYAEEGAGLLRWLAAAAPMTVMAGLYFARLRVEKRVGRLILLSGVVAAATLGLATLLVGRLGIAANGIGWLVGNGLVTATAIGNVWRDISSGRRTIRPMSGVKEFHSKEHRPMVVAAIPCYNEARFIGDVVRRARKHVNTVVVVDDGSSDGTVEVARAAGARVLQHLTNMGPGAAARDCLQAGLNMRADVLVTLDGDGQHNPDEVPDVIAPILAGEADLVIGSRFMGRYNNVAPYRRFGINVITFLYNFGTRTRITDGQSCFRAYNRRALKTLHITEAGFGFSVETLVQARNAGLHIREVSISCVYHEGSHSMNPVIHGVGVALMVMKHRGFAALSALGGRATHVTSEEATT